MCLCVQEWDSSCQKHLHDLEGSRWLHLAEMLLNLPMPVLAVANNASTCREGSLTLQEDSLKVFNSLKARFLESSQAEIVLMSGLVATWPGQSHAAR